jgi:hypothetical protein
MFQYGEDFESLQELRALIDTDTNNPVTVRMYALREAYGAGRLGVHVRRNISDELSGLGLGHFPGELPDDQERLVRLYKLGSPAAHLIGAVLNPSEDGDEAIRQAVAGDAASVLDEVRELVCS